MPSSPVSPVGCIRSAKLLFALLTCWVACGCSFGRMHVDTVATASQKPSNVAIYVSVADGDRPITDLQAKDFKIYEDGQLVDPAQSQQTLFPGHLVAAHRTLLLVDMSGATTEAGIRGHISRAVSTFVTTVRKTQPVSVYAFDGGRTIRFIGEYPMGDEAVDEVAPILKYTAQDASSNLNAAIVDASKQLEARLRAAGRPVRVGTLVIFTRGPDLAGRVPEHEMESAIDETDHHVFAIGVQDQASRYQPSFASETFMAKDIDSIESVFADASKRVAGLYNQHYLIVYCSPARAGDRSVRIETSTKDAEGEEITGSARAEFNADGFSSGCDVKSLPHFVAAAQRRGSAGSKSESGASSKPQSGSSSSHATSTEVDDTIVPPPDKPGYAK